MRWLPYISLYMHLYCTPSVPFFLPPHRSCRACVTSILCNFVILYFVQYLSVTCVRSSFKLSSDVYDIVLSRLSYITVCCVWAWIAFLWLVCWALINIPLEFLVFIEGCQKSKSCIVLPALSNVSREWSISGSKNFFQLVFDLKVILLMPFMIAWVSATIHWSPFTTFLWAIKKKKKKTMIKLNHLFSAIGINTNLFHTNRTPS